MTEQQLLYAIGEIVDEKIGRHFDVLDRKIDNASENLDKKIDDVSMSLNEKIDGVSMSLNEKIDGVSTSLNEKIDDVSISLNERIDGVSTSLNDKIDGVSGSLNQKINSVSKSFYTTMDKRFKRSESMMLDEMARLFEINGRKIDKVSQRLTQIEGELNALRCSNDAVTILLHKTEELEMRIEKMETA